MAVNFCTLAADTRSISAARNAWVSDLVCLCVMEDRSCVEKWVMEGASALKKFCEMDSRR
jgi:hypothetical protein